MSDAVIVGVLSLLGVIFTAVWQNKKLNADFEKHSVLQDAEMDKKIEVYAARTDEKLESLSKEIREHNQFAKRVPILETKMSIVEKKLDI